LYFSFHIFKSLIYKNFFKTNKKQKPFLTRKRFLFESFIEEYFPTTKTTLSLRGKDGVYGLQLFEISISYLENATNLTN